MVPRLAAGVPVAAILVLAVTLLAAPESVSSPGSEERTMAEDLAVLKTGIPPIDAAAPAQTETATFALGWFWGPDARFGVLKGVVHTRVGYSGGTKKNPTYHDLGDHTETLQIDYDPSQISYKELLAIFWESHSPGSRPWSRQYLAAIFFHNDAQKRLAMETRDQTAARIKGEVYTQILPAGEFYPAEDYHQKYFLRQDPVLLNELTRSYPRAKDLVASTAAARLNGYVAGYGIRAGLEAELSSLGLSPAGNKRLLGLVSKSEPLGPGHGCPIPR